MYSLEVELPSYNVGPGKSTVNTTSRPCRSTVSTVPLLIRKSSGEAQYPLSIIINSFTPNQQGHNMLHVQLSTSFPLRFHVMMLPSEYKVIFILDVYRDTRSIVNSGSKIKSFYKVSGNLGR